MSRLILTAGFALGGLGLLAVDAPQTPPASVPVQMVVTVEARHGAEIPALQHGDVQAYERHERLQVTDLMALKGENAGLELFFLMDDSSNTSLGMQLGDVRKFIEAQPAATAIGVGYMRNGTVDIVQNFTTDHSHAAKGLRLPLSSGGAMASPYLSLSDLIKRWPRTAARREVVMVTSGVDPLGGMGPMNPYMDAAIEDAQRSGVIVYAIYTPAAGHGGHSFYRINWAQNHLAQIAEETGGEAYMLGFGAPVSFAPYLEEIAGHLANQYRVTFLKPGEKAGLHDVKFTTEVPNAELVAAKKVFVPKVSAPGAREEPKR